MQVTISERRLSELIRNLESINDTDEEIAFKMRHYASRIFKHVYDGYGLKFLGMLEQSGGLGTMQFSIEEVGRNWQTSDFDWEKLIGALQFINALAVTVELTDMQIICTGLVAVGAADEWNNYASELERISPSEVQSKIESALLRFVYNKPTETTALSPNNQELRDLEMDGAFARAGMVDPSLRSRAVESYRQREIAEHEAAENRRQQQWYEEFRR